MQDFKRLEVWQLARVHAGTVYRQTSNFPREETFGLRAQMRRAAVSVCANIAEGCGRTGPAEFGRFLSIAMGSASDLECEIILAFDLGFIERAKYEELTASVTRLKRMIAGLLRSVRRRPKPNRQPTTENREPIDGSRTV